MADEQDSPQTDGENPEVGEEQAGSRSLKGAIEVSTVSVGETKRRGEDPSLTYYAAKNSALPLSDLMEKLTKQLHHWRESDHLQSEGSRIFHEQLGEDLRLWMREVKDSLQLLDARLSAASRCILERQQGLGTVAEQLAAQLSLRNQAIGELRGQLEETAQHMRVGFTWLGSQVSEAMQQLEATTNQESAGMELLNGEGTLLTKKEFDEEFSNTVKLIERSFTSLDARLDSFHQSFLKHNDENVLQTKEVGKRIATLLSTYIDAQESTKPPTHNPPEERKEVLRLGEMVQKRFIELNKKLDELSERLAGEDTAHSTETSRSITAPLSASIALGLVVITLVVLFWPQLRMFLNR